MFTIIGADGKEYGPVATDKVRDWIASGRANLQTRARRDGETDWKTLADFVEFVVVAEAQPPSVALAAPGAAAPVSVLAGLPLAGRWERLGAQLLDGFITMAALTPGLIMLVTAGAFGSNGNNAFTPLALAGICVMGLALIVVVVIQIYLLSTAGQTMGKKLLKIRIVNFEDEGNPGFVKAFLLRSFVNGLIGSVPALGGIYSLVDICFIFRADRRCIHDLIAGTKVVAA